MTDRSIDCQPHSLRPAPSSSRSAARTAGRIGARHVQQEVDTLGVSLPIISPLSTLAVRRTAPPVREVGRIRLKDHEAGPSPRSRSMLSAPADDHQGARLTR